jgi:hypothetical protein
MLILSQSNMIHSRTLLLIQCRLLDFLLRTCVTISDWLNACVAIERATTIVQDIGFNKIKSQHIYSPMVHCRHRSKYNIELYLRSNLSSFSRR